MLAALAAIPAIASAQSGVSDDRVAVPDGPGSVEGLGDNATVAGNMGLMSFAVPFELPRGFARATPTLGLSYSSGAGNSIVGVGWTMETPSIERLTLRGLPTYTADDELVADGGSQLVRVSAAGGRAVYRSRFEGDFVRYTWHDAGAAGYFTAEYPDGSVGYFGATADGTLVPDARLADANGATFRYHLVERVDVYGHRVVYEYQREGGAPYPVRIGYVHDSAGTPRYTVSFGYATRPDELSDGKPGFEERITRRLSTVTIAVRGEVIRRYVLTYEPASHAGQSRLATVEQYGRDGGRYPATWKFGYSRSLGGVCTGPACGAPFVVHMGVLPTGSAMQAGTATLIDINGDALPDVLDTSVDGFHRFIVNRLDGQGGSSFDPTPRQSAIGTRSAFSVERPAVQELDLDGDGLADLINVAQGTALCNRGTGDWTTAGCQASGELGLALAGGSGDPAGVRFLDVDGDRRIDAIQTTGTDSITVRRNTGARFEALSGAEPIGVAFDQARLFLSDLNGDGLLDPVHFFETGAVRARTHLGRARWSGWYDVPAPPLSASQLDRVTLEDLDGDGRDDLVLVEPDAVSYALNRGGTRFDAAFTRITAADVAGLPARAPDTAVRFADMNANGSVDVVWIQRDGRVDYLELFPVPPNLLSRIENGLGLVQEITYGTAADQRRDAPDAWTHVLPIAASVVTRVDTWTTLTGGENGAGLHEVVTYRYRDGFYAGHDRELRGFGWVEAITAADSQQDTQEPGRTVETFDLGATDTYRKGRLLTTARFSGGGGDERAIDEVRVGYDECAVTGVPATGLRLPVRHVCEVERTTVLKEGAPPERWVTLRATTAYDGYGRVTLASNHGVVGVDGDEAITATDYVDPETGTGGRWRLDLPTRVREFAVEGGLATETLTYYDGPAFVGLPLGQATRGDATRVTARRSADAVVAVERAAYDAHGNVVATLDPLGDPGDETSHRRSFTYDATGLQVVRTDVHVGGEAPYRLRREYSYDPAFDHLTEATGWMVVGGGAPASARKQTSLRYDEFGRQIAVIEPGDTEAAPTIEYEWLLGNPATRIVERRRSVRGGAADLERSICLDGRGRTYQDRVRIAANEYQVNGFAAYNGRGAAVRSYQPYRRPSGFCETAEPDGVAFEQRRYDGLQREIRTTLPAAEPGGPLAERATVYAPLVASAYDEDDLDPDSPGADTPTRTHFDGLGRVVAIERVLRAGEAGVFTRARHDELGRLVEVIDPAGNRKRQAYDLLGRVVEVDDPSAGVSRYVYDDAGNLLARTDGRGVTTRATYDGANRPLATWDEADRQGTEVRFRYDFGGSCAPTDCTHAEGQAIEISYPLDPEVVARLGGEARGVDHRGFDSRGQAIYDARTIGRARLATHYELDNAGRLTATIYPDGRRLERTYDGGSRLAALDDVVTAARYGERGELAELTRANGATEAWSFDGQLRLARRTVTAAGGQVLEDHAYRRDARGGIVGMTGAAMTGATTAAGRLDATFTYDGWHRLITADYRGDAPETHVRSYGDTEDVLAITSSLGTKSPAHAGDVGYNGRAGAVASARGLTYAYDAAGQLVTRGDLTFTWDHLGRLVEATRGGAPVARFSYSVDATRVARVEGASVTLYAGDDYELRDGIGVAYPRIGGHRVARLTSAAFAAALLGDPAPVAGGDGEVNAADAWVAHARPAADRPAAAPTTLLRSAARRLLLEAEGDAVMLHADHLGNLDLATDGAGGERGRRRYVVPAGTSLTTGYVDEYGFTGQEEIASLGLVRFQYRWLDPLTLRWTQPDPLFEHLEALSAPHAGELAARYAYVGNDLVNATDPTGLSKYELHIISHSTSSSPHSRRGGNGKWGHVSVELHGESDGKKEVRHVGLYPKENVESSQIAKLLGTAGEVRDEEKPMSGSRLIVELTDKQWKALGAYITNAQNGPPKYAGLKNNCGHFACQVAGEAGRLIEADVQPGTTDRRVNLLKNLGRRARNWLGFLGPWSLHRYITKRALKPNKYPLPPGVQALPDL